jgi:hypothetical protein
MRQLSARHSLGLEVVAVPHQRGDDASGLHESGGV